MTINVPFDLGKFLFDYKHSRFIECNRVYAKESIQKMNGIYVADDKKIKSAQYGLSYVKSVLEGFKRNYWLAAGTLLGIRF